MNGVDRDVLIVKYLDGSAGSEEVVALNELLKVDAASRSLLREASFQALTLADLGQGRGLVRRPLSPRWNYRPLAGAAAVLLICLAWAIWLLRTEPPLLTVVRATGAVSWSSDGDPSGTAIDSGMQLGPGMVTLEGATSSAELILSDGSSVTLTGQTELSLAPGKDKPLFLRRGSMMMDVRPQSKGRPLRLRTPTAEIDVLGTSFCLSAGADQTMVTVGEGNVRVRRRVDGATTEVPKGSMATATLDASRPLETRPIPPLVSQWRATFDVPPPALWQGEWIPADATGPGRLRNVLDVSYRRRDGTIVPAHVVSVRDPSAVATVRPDSTLRVKWRVRNPAQGVLLLLSVLQPDGKFSGNFQTELRPDAFPSDSSGWRLFSAPISSLETRYPEGARIPSGGRVTLVFLACYSATAELEVAEVAFE